MQRVKRCKIQVFNDHCNRYGFANDLGPPAQFVRHCRMGVDSNLSKGVTGTHFWVKPANICFTKRNLSVKTQA